jgi:hypothetical protein
MLVFADGVLRPHHLGRGCREFKSGLASIMNITPIRLADIRTCEHSASVELVLKNHEDTIHDLPIALE